MARYCLDEKTRFDFRSWAIYERLGCESITTRPSAGAQKTTRMETLIRRCIFMSAETGCAASFATCVEAIPALI